VFFAGRRPRRSRVRVVQTKPCVRCGVEIHVASRRCTFCGSPQQTGTPGPWWVPWAAGVAGLVVVVLAIVVVSRGGGSSAGGPEFRAYASDGLTTLVPVGWTRHREADPPGTLKLAFSVGNQPEDQLAVTAVRPTRRSAESRAAKLRAMAATRLGYTQRFFGRILFPGGRPAWLLAYESDGFSHAAYAFTACKPSVAMTVEVSAPSRSELAGLAEPIAAASGPTC
jgi:hypothetical protein